MRGKCVGARKMCRCAENALVHGKYIGAREFKEKDMGKHKDIKGKRGKGEKEVDKEGDFWVY